jgi:hypothetical protein
VSDQGGTVCLIGDLITSEQALEVHVISKAVSIYKGTEFCIRRQAAEIFATMLPACPRRLVRSCWAWHVPRAAAAVITRLCQSTFTFYCVAC